MVESNHNLSQNIKMLRKEMGKNLEEFASDSGVGRGTVQDIESGRANVTLDTVDIMAEHLGVSARFLLDGPGGTHRLAHELLGTIRLFCMLPLEKRERAVYHFQELITLISGGEA